MLTVISFPPGLRLIGLTAFETILPQGVPARLWRRGLWRRGDGTGVALGFFSGLMVLLHLRSSTGGLRRALPDGVRSLEWDPREWDYLRLNPLKNPRWITQSRFKAVSTAGVSLLVLRMS